MTKGKPLPHQKDLTYKFSYLDGKIFRNTTGKEVKGRDDGGGYLRVKIFKERWQKHRIIWKMLKGYDPDTIDHINGNKLDNRIENLRDIPNNLNAKNKKPYSNGISRFKGVYFHKEKGVFASQIGVNGSLIFLGSFTDEVDAAKAYDVAALELHGKYAKTNEMLGLY